MKSPFLAVLLVTTTLCSATAQQPEAGRPPNVVLIVADDLGWADVGCFGSSYYETPNVDRLAREGMRFTQGYAACAVCSPTRAAILTGRYPARLGVTDWIHHASAYSRSAVAAGRHEDGFESAPDRKLSTPRNRPWLELDEVTIAELLKPLGYATCHIGKWHLGPEGWLPDDQGFDENHGGFEVGQPPSYFDPYANRRFEGIRGLAPRNEGEYLTDREADEAVSFVERNKKRPFFLYMAHYAVHSPLQAKRALVEKYRDKQGTHQDVPVYAAMIESVDDAVGAILDCLDDNGLAENTIVVFTSDNGGAVHFRATNNAPLRKGKGFPYEGGLRVPYVVRWPGVARPGAVSDEPICSIDLLPTIAEATGAALPGGRAIDGVSLVAALSGAGGIDRDTLVWHFPHYWWGGRIRPYSVIRHGRYKLIRHYETGRRELFDLEADPTEARDLAAALPLVARRLDEELTASLSEQGARMPVAADSAESAKASAAAGFERLAWRQDGVWAGPDVWTNPMEDWRVVDGVLRAERAGANRNAFWLTRELGAHRGDFETSVVITRLDDGEGSAGFRVGVRGPLDGYMSAALKGRGLDAGLTRAGVLFIGSRDDGEAFADLAELDTVELSLRAEPDGERYRVTLAAGGHEVARTVDGERLVGGLALVNDFPPGGRDLTARHGFARWRIAGSKIVADDARRFGPILWAQHTLSRGVLKMTAQMPPLADREPKNVGLQVLRAGGWRTIAGAPIDARSRTATFRIEGWDDSADVPYRLVYALKDPNGSLSNHYFEGRVRRDPADERELVLAAFTGNTDTGFPNAKLVENVSAHDPDVLFFSGDQIYESVGGFGIHRKPVDLAILNYLRKWYLFGWAFRDLMRDRPAVILPDDHDVYQGNVWGNGGNPITIAEHEAGGYAMDADFVNVVMRTQTAHMPDPFDPTPIDQGISVCYGDMVYGRVSFAIIEDRKFKAGPRGRVTSGSNRPDHVKDESIDVAALDVPDAPLLGGRQLRFLRAWAADWRGADLKAVLSQTIFANVANYHGPRQEFLVADLDSNGWPQSGRNRALREIRRGFAVHIAGDQHLPSIVQHGIEEHGDASWSFCVPSIAAGYPRSWRPDAEGRPVNNRQGGLPNTGEYFDGLGNRITVHAIGNPEREYRKGVLERLHDKASGYGLVRFDKGARTIRLECWRLLVDVTHPKPSDQFPGWPKTIDMLDNYARPAAAMLPTLRVSGMEDPVVQVFDERDGELVYALRIRGTVFRPKVFAADASYRIVIGEPGTDDVVELNGVRPGEGSRRIDFPGRR